MATTVKLKNSVTTTSVPSTLVQGEVAINITDKKVWVGNASTTPVLISDSQTTSDNTWTGKQTFTGSSSKLSTVISNIGEPITVSATAATGTINFDVTTQSIVYYTSNASGDWTLNFRGSSGTSLNTLMSTGQAITVTFMATQGATPYVNTAITVDGNSVTPKWQGGETPIYGFASGIDVYTYVIIKTGSATFTVLGSQIQFN